MVSFFKSRSKAFQNAFAGCWHVIQTQPNAWIHGLATVLVILLGLYLQLSIRDWAVIIIAIALVWISEFLNTALESVIDLVSPQEHKLARVGKDVGAGAVLLAAISAIIIGLLILGPPMLDKIQELFTN